MTSIELYYSIKLIAIAVSVLSTTLSRQYKSNSPAQFNN